jgi:hypothetical protein
VTDVATIEADPTPEQQVAAMESALGEARGTIYALEERLHGVDRMLDEKGWHPLYHHDALDGGLTLSQIQVASEQLRELVAANPILKRALRARLTYVWGGGVQYGLWSAGGDPAALTAALRAKMRAPGLRRALFSNTAHAEFESAAFTDGNLFLLFGPGDTVQRLAMAQITADMRDPDDQETIWMFRREWDRNPSGTTPEQRQHSVAWYYTDAFTGRRATRVEVSPGKTEPVDRTRTVLHHAFNAQLGWAYGIPDAMPVIAWLRLYREFLTNGFIMSRALAQIAFKMSSKSAPGGTRMAAEVALPGQGGNAVSMGEGQDMSALSTAGKGYDFGSGEPLAAAVAAGIEVSVDTLLAKGTQTELDMDTRAAAEMRRLDWDDVYDRIFAQIGSSKPLRASWRDLPVEQVQRQMQAWTLARNSGAFEGEVIQQGMARTLKIAEPGKVPSDYQTTPGGTEPSTTGATATDGTGQGQGDGNPSGNTDTRDGETTTD